MTLQWYQSPQALGANPGCWLFASRTSATGLSTLPKNLSFRDLVDAANLRWRIERDHQ